MSISYRLGRFFGEYKKGIMDAFSTTGSRPWIGDDSAYSHPTLWGEGLALGKKPTTKAEYISHFQSWVYIAVKLNAQSVASVPLKLYVAKPEGKQVRNFPTKEVTPEELKYLQGQASLKHYFAKGAQAREGIEQ